VNIGILSSASFPPEIPDGIGNYVYNIACKLVERGHDVTVITRGSNRGWREDSVQTMNKTIRVFRVPIIQAYPFHVHIHGIFASKLINDLSTQLDIVHAHSPYVPAIAPPTPLVTTIHSLERVSAFHYETKDLLGMAHKMSSWVFSSVETRLFRNSKMLTAVSGHVFDELELLYGIKRRRIVLGNGVDPERFVPLENGRGDYILYVGLMGYRKGLFDLLKCAKYVCEKKGNVSFVLVGSGPLLPHIQSEARRMGVARSVLFTGHVAAMSGSLIRLYQNAAMLVLPSYYEGLPTVVLEAMSCGIPVIATRIGGNTEIISNGLNGFLVPPRSPREMAERILMLLENEELRKRIGRAARRTIEERYTWDKVSQRVLECYVRLLDPGS